MDFNQDYTKAKIRDDVDIKNIQYADELRAKYYGQFDHVRNVEKIIKKD